MLFLPFQSSRLSGLLFLHHATLKVGHAGLCLFLCGIHRISGLCRHILDIFFDSICLVFHFIFRIPLRQHRLFEPARCPMLEVVLPRFLFRSGIFSFSPLASNGTSSHRTSHTARNTASTYRPCNTVFHTPSPMSHEQDTGLRNILRPTLLTIASIK